MEPITAKLLKPSISNFKSIFTILISQILFVLIFGIIITKLDNNFFYVILSMLLLLFITQFIPTLAFIYNYRDSFNSKNFTVIDNQTINVNKMVIKFDEIEKIVSYQSAALDSSFPSFFIHDTFYVVKIITKNKKIFLPSFVSKDLKKDIENTINLQIEIVHDISKSILGK